MNAARLSILLIAMMGLISSLLPWATQTTLTPYVSSRSLSGVGRGFAWGLMLLCIIAIVVAMTGKRRARLKTMRRWIIFTTGLLTLGYCGWLLFSMREDNIKWAKINISLIEMPAIGFWIGAIIGLSLCLSPFIVRGKEV